jgi:hypothetical protein
MTFVGAKEAFFLPLPASYDINFSLYHNETKKCSLEFRGRVIEDVFSCLHFTKTRSRLTKFFALLPDFTATFENVLNTCAVMSRLEVRGKEPIKRGKIHRFLLFLSLFLFSHRPSQLDKQKQSVIDKMSSNYSPRIMFSNRSSFIICRKLLSFSALDEVFCVLPTGNMEKS